MIRMIKKYVKTTIRIYLILKIRKIKGGKKG